MLSIEKPCSICRFTLYLRFAFLLVCHFGFPYFQFCAFATTSLLNDFNLICNVICDILPKSNCLLSKLIVNIRYFSDLLCPWRRTVSAFQRHSSTRRWPHPLTIKACPGILLRFQIALSFSAQRMIDMFPLQNIQQWRRRKFANIWTWRLGAFEWEET